jgi:hypothetical protein
MCFLLLADSGNWRIATNFFGFRSGELISAIDSKAASLCLLSSDGLPAISYLHLTPH